MGLVGKLDDLSERNRRFAEMAKEMADRKAKAKADRKAKVEARKLKPKPNLTTRP